VFYHRSDIEMSSQRRSTCTGHSHDTTAVDPDSTRPSPRMGDSFQDRRDSCAPPSSIARSATVSSVSSLAESISTPYTPTERYGWPRLAEIMADVPEFAAFPRFRDLNIKNLLYYKVQLDVVREKIMNAEEGQTLKAERYDRVALGYSPEYHDLLVEMRDLLRGYSTSYARFASCTYLLGCR